MTKELDTRKETLVPAKVIMPGVVGERAKQFIDMMDPLDLEMELATARAVLSLESEKYGAEWQAAMDAQNKGIPAKDPDIRGVLAALGTIDKIAANMFKAKHADSIPAERLAEIFLEIRRAMRAVCGAEHPALAEKIEREWQRLDLSGS